MSPRTSETDPLRVDFISRDVLRAPGRLGLTIAPGQRDATCAQHRDLDADLRTLRRAHGASVLVSLIEPAERELLSIPDLLDRARAHGLGVRALPIRDRSVPLPVQREELAALVRDIIAALGAGDTVVIHCRGGLGRSGLVAACVLRTLGLDATAAIAGVRAARPGAIETPEQLAWVEALAH
jgi:predicted protein tyrosine phosphatase